jgi:hypothetical protein
MRPDWTDKTGIQLQAMEDLSERPRGFLRSPKPRGFGPGDRPEEGRRWYCSQVGLVTNAVALATFASDCV